MSEALRLKEAERKAFTTAFQDGLWDVLIGRFVLRFDRMFAIVPLLSASLGDFWSSAVFLPFWALVSLIIWLVRRYVVAPRVGVVRFGPARRARLARFSMAMTVLNSVALALGIIAAALAPTVRPRVPDSLYMLGLGLIVLRDARVGMSIAAYVLSFARLYLLAYSLRFRPWSASGSAGM